MAIQKDLFGQKIKVQRPKYEASLERLDGRTVSDRAERVRWLSKVIPRNSLYGFQLETYYVFQEVKGCFVQGLFVSSIVMAASFVEHWLSSNLEGLGYSKEAKSGLFVMVKCCRENKLVNATLLNQIDKLRKIRNPFVHLKNFQHPDSLGQRSFSQLKDADSILEQDAKESLITMYSITVYGFKNT